MNRVGAVLTVMIFGCSSESALTVRQAPLESTGPYDFVLSSLVIDANDTSPAAGFNLDGRYSASMDSLGCSVVDRISNLDLDQNYMGCSSSSGTCQGGVDNVLPHLADAIDTTIGTVDSRAKLSSNLASGRWIYLLRLTGVDDPADDDNVTVSLFTAYSVDWSCERMISGDGVFVVANQSLAEEDDASQPLIIANGALVAGRLQVTFPASPVLETFNAGLWGAIYVRVNFDSSLTAGTNGNIGGAFDVEQTAALLEHLYPRGGGAIAIATAQAADLYNAMSSTCAGQSGSGLLGLGARFSLAKATVIGTASTKTPGSCGY